MNKTTLQEIYKSALDDATRTGEELAWVMLFTHMPTGDTEQIINYNIPAKMEYIDKTYNDELVHNNCKDIYIEDIAFGVKDDAEYPWNEALDLMLQGEKMKLKSWGGYWEWDAEKETIMMHTKEGEVKDIRQTDRVLYTLQNIASEKWIIATKHNCLLLGGVTKFDYKTAQQYYLRGISVMRASTGVELSPTATLTMDDVDAKDWVFAELNAM